MHCPQGAAAKQCEAQAQLLWIGMPDQIRSDQIKVHCSAGTATSLPLLHSKATYVAGGPALKTSAAGAETSSRRGLHLGRLAVT